ncbi:hypothetical protein SNOG_08522 [Parastagonospora nodorum SN15]|uniref:Uncharacterized protein n=1 Tax=Phaeosphaeria nodorum (strain SN15 / ATCC MYA-4574 / FGSC 10173) TaxID=321614 RepID=Q0UI92_PHANO|nr:hypothetical protein SNOG_08522 [Parastagonospora nodorum SN15]EAT83690.2 hypothetical protein SNOG_08522 [Parastagonospora nodorum SN15]
MAEQPQNLRALFSSAERARQELASAYDSNSPAFQENLRKTIATYEECLKLSEQISLFSPNESLEDISSGDLQYLDAYDILSASDSKLLDAYSENKANFSTASARDAAARRDAKIARFREEKEIKRKLEYLQQNPKLAENDEHVVRDLHLTSLSFMVFQTFQALESMALELQIISMAPAAPPPGVSGSAPDERQDGRDKDKYSERLDGQLPGLRNTGPLLSSDGKPMRPFTLLDSRQSLKKDVFRERNLPTMTIDEYLEEEKRRGGMIEGGGPQSEVRPEPNEDDFDAADEETMKQRAWDEPHALLLKLLPRAQPTRLHHRPPIINPNDTPRLVIFELQSPSILSAYRFLLMYVLYRGPSFFHPLLSAISSTDSSPRAFASAPLIGGGENNSDFRLGESAVLRENGLNEGAPDHAGVVCAEEDCEEQRAGGGGGCGALDYAVEVGGEAG